MFRDRVEDVLRSAAAPTWERIRQDRKRLPSRLAKLLVYVEQNLFDTNLNVASAQRATGIRDHSLSSVFRSYIGTTLRVYIEEARLEIADRMLRGSGIDVGRISLAVGYECHGTFSRAYKAWAGERPKDVTQQPAEPAFDYPTWRRAWRGALDADEARDFIEKFKRIYPDAEPPERELEERKPQQPELAKVSGEPVRIEVDGAAFERFRAEELWREIHSLPAEVQHAKIRRYRFHSPALFDLLRRKSREEGRRSRRRGIELASLALASLEGGKEDFGEKIHDLRALGWAWLANAYRLAFDFPAAEAAFKEAEAEWRYPRDRKDQRVIGTLFDLKVALRIFQRRFDEALPLAKQTQDLFRLAGAHFDELTVLIQQAAIHGYAGRPADSIVKLHEAESLLKPQHDRHLAFAIYANLASDHAQLGQYRQATEHLASCREQLDRRGEALEVLKIQWIEAMILQGSGELAAAEELLSGVRKGYLVLEDSFSLGIVTLDLAILHAEQGRLKEVVQAALEAVPLLEALSLYPETLAAVGLLAEAARAGTVPLAVLRGARAAVTRDPLAGSRPEPGAGHAFRPPS